MYHFQSCSLHFTSLHFHLDDSNLSARDEAMYACMPTLEDVEPNAASIHADIETGVATVSQVHGTCSPLSK